MIKVSCKLETYPDRDTEKKETIEIESHWIHDDRIILMAGDKKYVLLKKDLVAATENATRTARW